LGQDGKLYVGFLKNGNFRRVVNPGAINPTSANQSVESIGGSPNGRPILSMAFMGADLYIGTDQGLSVVRNATTCIGNAGGCGNAVQRLAGATVAVTTDGVGRVYFSANAAGTVYRYTPADGRVIAVASGFLFVGGHTNSLMLDGFGNLWIGDDTSDGTFNFTGRLWRVPAALLQTF
jgi:ligand-binding sensor domain-containing protein